MARASPGIGSFNAGELSPLVDARIEKDWYRSGCKKLENFIPLVQGPAMRDPGTKYIAAVKDSADRTWLARFIFSSYEAYVLEFGDAYIRFYTDRGQLNFSTPSAYSGATAYVKGDLVLSAGTSYYCIAATTGNAPPNATYWYALTGTIYEIPTPWAAADLTGPDGEFYLDIDQSGDQLYITHKGGDYEPVRISRNSDTDWTIERLVTDGVLQGGPFEDVNKDETITVYASAATGTVTLTASSAIFLTNHIGGLFYLQSKKVDTVPMWEPGVAYGAGVTVRSDGKNYISANAATSGTVRPSHTVGTMMDGNANVNWEFTDPGYGWGRITAIGGGGTTATLVVQSRIPANAVLVGNASHRWAFGRFSAERGWPTHVAFFRERLVFAKGQTLMMSVVGDFTDFKAKDDGGLVTIEQAYVGTIATGLIDDVQWMSPSDSGLVIGTASAELVCMEMTSSAPFGPGNVKVEPKTTHGGRGIKSVRIGRSALFVQRSGRNIRQFGMTEQGYRSVDLSARNTQITIGGIVDMAWQQDPWNVLWCVRADGVLLGLTFNEEQEVVAWHRHTLGGSFSTGDSVVEAVQSIPSPTNDRDDLYLIVKRTIDGATKRYVEVLMPEYTTGDASTSPFYVRCGATYTGAAASTITGLDHLEGENLDVLVDGATHPRCRVISGAITLDRTGTVVHAGLPYTSTLQTMRLEAGSQDGVAQGKIKRVVEATVRFFNTLCGKAGPSDTSLETLQFRSTTDPMGSPPSIYTGDKRVPWPGDYETDAHLVIVQDQPLPMTVIGIFPQVITQDKG